MTLLEKIMTLNAIAGYGFVAFLLIIGRRRHKPFQDAVKEISKLFGEEYLANKFDVSVSTVHRWKNGKTRPLPLVRNMILRGLTDLDNDSRMK